jgi:hypothetical protein
MRGKRWMTGVLAVGLSMLSAGPAVAHGARGHHRHHHGSRTVTVGGTVTTPHTYTRADLAALPQQSFAVGHRTDTGVSLEDLVNTAAPVLPTTKNALLRVTVTVQGAGFPVTFALGELDSGFGNHPAYLALTSGSRTLHSPKLVVPGDSWPLRTVRDVRSITVGVQSPAPITPPSAGALTIQSPRGTVVLTAAQLAALPSQTLQVSFQAGGTAPQTHTEIGPTLATVLRAAHIHGGLDTWVAAVGSDGYVATVTPAEAFVGGKQLLVSLNEDGVPQSQPRLVVSGDVKGGRYVSGVDNLVVGGGVFGGHHHHHRHGHRRGR